MILDVLKWIQAGLSEVLFFLNRDLKKKKSGNLGEEISMENDGK